MSLSRYRSARVNSVLLLSCVTMSAGCFDPSLLPIGLSIPDTRVETEPPVLEPIRSVVQSDLTGSKLGDLNNDGAIDRFDLDLFEFEMDRFNRGLVFNRAADLDGDDALTDADRTMLQSLVGPVADTRDQYR